MKNMVERRRQRAGEQPRSIRQPTLAEQREQLIATIMRESAIGVNGEKLAVRQAKAMRPGLFTE